MTDDGHAPTPSPAVSHSSQPLLSARTKRRSVLRYGAAGLTAAGIGVTGLAHPFHRAAGAPAAIEGGFLDLYVNEGLVPMVDGRLVYMRGFGEHHTPATDPSPSLTINPHVFGADGSLVASHHHPLGAAIPHDGRPTPHSVDPALPLHHLVRRTYWASFYPRRTIVAETGSTIRIRVHNGLAKPHQLRIEGTSADTGQVPAGGTAELVFDAPAPGTYVYQDPQNAPVERVLGLHGVLVVVPADDPWRLAPGGVEFERQWVWICNDIDTRWAAREQRGLKVNPRRTPAVPDYFTLNDRSGFHSLGVSTDEAINHAAHEETLASGSARRTDIRNFSLDGTGSTVVTGQLLRLVNAGLAVHQLHFHGNHVWTVRRNGLDLGRSVARVDAGGHILLQQWEDLVELDPLDRTEVVLPLKLPPDVLPPVAATQDCDWHYPMHCHAEMSQTAGGGLYPGGLVADWVLAPPMPR